MRLRKRLLARPLLALAIVLGLAGVASAAVPAFKASEAPAFCNTCHEMKPYYTAWSAGPHRGVDCVACHVEPGTVNHVTHKVTAAKELAIHLTGDPRFPAAGVTVPDARCLKCHADISRARPASGFSHADHAKKGTCVSCHDGIGHKVSLQTLKAANLLRAGVAIAATASASASGSSETTASRHVAVSCTKCHDLGATACSACHTPAHKARGECSTCHQPGAAFTFTHPASTACATCHQAPAKHFPGDCATCHAPSVPFAKTPYTHTSSACETCHVRPSGHRAGACATCHVRPGVSWAFSHPASSACASCHQAPARHYGAQCSGCHAPGRAFASAVFRHLPGFDCARCHKSTHRSYPVACGSCHTRPGSSWVHTHTSSRSCSSCHAAPAGHYGRTCSSCHSPRRPWTSAVFAHGAIPGGQHTYRSFACARCHPNGYASHYCSCHPGGRPPSG